MRRLFVSLLIALLVSTPAFASGFQVTAQGARAMGMGLAYTAVADDASAIYYNPGGLAFIQSNIDIVAGAMLATNLEGEFQSAVGVEEQRAGNNVLPQAYGVGTLWNAKVG